MAEPVLLNATPCNGEYLELLTPGQQSVSMRSGVVTLQPGEAVGWHSTGAREELVIVLSGRGEARGRAGAPTPMHAGAALYVPPEHEHDIVNTGADVLRYVYVVAPTVAAATTETHA
jgi:mannose-6-phosphate isomerase-like protein (cupin superfamily)